MNTNAQRVFDERFALGQREYGVGKENKGYQRDNIQDAFEEVCDARIIMRFAEERFRDRWAGYSIPTSPTDDDMRRARLIRRTHNLVGLIETVMDELADLHTLIGNEWPEYVDGDTTVRPVYLKARVLTDIEVVGIAAVSDPLPGQETVPIHPEDETS